MGWWNRLFARSRPDPALAARYLPRRLESGVVLTPDEALSLSAVWACVDAIAKAIASCQWNVYLPKGRGRRELLENDPLHWMLNTRPNAEMTAIAFREALLYQGIPFGNAYAEIRKDLAGRVVELWPLESYRVTPRRDPNGVLFYEYVQPDGTVDRLEQSQVFHLRGPGLTGLMGENIVARAARSLGTAVAAERFSAQFFGQSCSPEGAIKHPGKLSAQAHENLRKDIDEKRRNKHGTIILEEGADWVPFTSEPQKTQLLESRQFSVEEICRWFGVPPHKVQHLLRSTFSNIEHLSIEFVRDALTPWCRRFEQEADFKLLRQGAPWRHTCIDTSPLSHGDALSRAQAHAVWRQNGIMSSNEIRAKEGMNDAGPDGDVLLVQSNLTTVERILNPPAPVADPGQAPAGSEAAEADGDVAPPPDALEDSAMLSAPRRSMAP
jgi:HK97 family phage portal protein